MNIFNFSFANGKQEFVLNSVHTIILRGSSISNDIVPSKKLFVFDRSSISDKEEDNYSQFACKAKDFPEMERVHLYDNGTGGQFSIGEQRYSFCFVNKNIISVNKKY
jgi:hypothetical protein